MKWTTAVLWGLTVLNIVLTAWSSVAPLNAFTAVFSAVVAMSTDEEALR